MHNDVLTIIFDCVGNLNKQLPPDKRLPVKAESILIGEGGILDSLSLITLLVAVEQGVRDRLAIQCSLLDKVAFENKMHPLRTIGSLADWILANGRKP